MVGSSGSNECEYCSLCDTTLINNEIIMHNNDGCCGKEITCLYCDCKGKRHYLNYHLYNDCKNTILCDNCLKLFHKSSHDKVHTCGINNQLIIRIRQLNLNNISPVTLDTIIRIIYCGNYK